MIIMVAGLCNLIIYFISLIVKSEAITQCFLRCLYHLKSQVTVGTELSSQVFNDLVLRFVLLMIKV